MSSLGSQTYSYNLAHDPTLKKKQEIELCYRSCSCISCTKCMTSVDITKIDFPFFSIKNKIVYIPLLNDMRLHRHVFRKHVGDVVPWVAIKTLFQPLLVKVVANETHASTQNKNSI